MDKSRDNTAPVIPQCIVADEDPAAFNALLEELTAEYQPETQMQQIVVGYAARAAWELARANREFDKSQCKLYSQQPDMRNWDAAQQSEFERMVRYRNQAERAFGRRLQAAENIRKLHLQVRQRTFWQHLQQELLSLAKQRLQLSAARSAKAAAPKAYPKEKAQAREIPRWPKLIMNPLQVIEIRELQGNITIRMHPSTDDMHLLANAAETGALIIRCFEFPGGVPARYSWVNGPGMRNKGILWEQCFNTVEDWRAHVAREAIESPGHFLPAGDPGNTDSGESASPEIIEIPPTEIFG